MEDNWASLINQLNVSPASIHVVNRAQLIDDSFNLARAGLLNYTVPLSLIKYLDQENDVIPWFLAMKHLNYVLDRMARSDDGYVEVLVSKLFGIVIVYQSRFWVKFTESTCVIIFRCDLRIWIVIRICNSSQTIVVWVIVDNRSVCVSQWHAHTPLGWKEVLIPFIFHVKICFGNANDWDSFDWYFLVNILFKKRQIIWHQNVLHISW